MNISIGARTDVGGRTNNEDCLAVLDRERVPLRADAVLVIADGMGGRANGEEASGIAVKIVRETLMELLDPSNEMPLPPAEDILAAAMRRANSTVYELSQENPDTPGMGTTCIAALVSEGILTMAHVGDSRAYLVRDNEIRTLTTDHTYVADQVRAGNMTSDAAKKSRFRNVITRAIGIAPTVQPDFESFPLLDTDTLVLCTDGLSNTLDEDGILAIVRRNETAQNAANGLLEAAKAGGVRDNVTIITVRVAADVQSSRLRRLPIELNGTKSEDPQVEQAELFEPAAPVVQPQIRMVRPPGPSPFRLAALAAVSAILGAGALFEIGYLKNPETTGAGSIPPAQRTLAAQTNYLSLVYQAPSQLFYKPIRPNFLMLGDSGLFVALAQSGKMVHLGLTGLADDKAPPDAMAPDTTVPTMSYAIDPAGNLYESDSGSGTISRTSPDGSISKVIIKNLAQPGALAVDPTGDIYIIDNGELFVVHPLGSSGKP